MSPGQDRGAQDRGAQDWGAQDWGVQDWGVQEQGRQGQAAPGEAARAGLTPEQERLKAAYVRGRGYWTPWTEGMLRFSPGLLDA